MIIPDDELEIDALLRHAGAEWRRTQPPPPQPEPSWFQNPHSKKRRWLIPALSAAGVAAVLLAFTVLLTRPAGDLKTPPVGAGTSGDVSDLVVHDGDVVEVTGQVIAAPNKTVVLCPPIPTIEEVPAQPVSPGTNASPSRVLSCPADLAVSLIGVDVARLDRLEQHAGTRAGYVTLRGVWRDRSITVTDQKPPATPSQNNGTLPCSTPPGGWRTDGRDNVSERNALDAYVRSQPDRFSSPRLVHIDSGRGDEVTVLVVPAVQGGLAATDRELKALYRGNLCISRGATSLAEGQQIAQQVSALPYDPANPISGATLDTDGQRVIVSLFMVTESRFEQFAAIGLDKLTPVPVVRPVR